MCGFVFLKSNFFSLSFAVPENDATSTTTTVSAATATVVNSSTNTAITSSASSSKAKDNKSNGGSGDRRNSPIIPNPNHRPTYLDCQPSTSKQFRAELAAYREQQQQQAPQSSLSKDTSGDKGKNKKTVKEEKEVIVLDSDVEEEEDEDDEVQELNPEIQSPTEEASLSALSLTLHTGPSPAGSKQPLGFASAHKRGRVQGGGQNQGENSTSAASFKRPRIIPLTRPQQQQQPQQPQKPQPQLQHQHQQQHHHHHRRRLLINRSRAEQMEMRRAIRGSARGSAYHHRKLMEEVRRKYCLLPSGRRAQGQGGPPSSASQGPSLSQGPSSSSPQPSSSSILDTAAFAHLEPVFSDLYLTSRVLPRARSLADHVAALRRQRPDYARLLPPGVLGPCTSASAFGSSASASSSSSASTSSKSKNTSYEALQQLAAKQLPPPPPSTTTTSSESRSSTAEAREFLAQASKRLTEAISSSSSTTTDESEVEGGDADDDEAAAVDLSLVGAGNSGRRNANDNEGGNRGLRKKAQKKLTERERMTAYEAANRLRIGEAAIQHVLTPSRRRETVALVGRVQQGLPFANHFYSEED